MMQAFLRILADTETAYDRFFGGRDGAATLVYSHNMCGEDGAE